MLKKIALSVPLLGAAASSFAAAPSWATDSTLSSGLTDIVAAVAPPALAIVGAVAGVRVAIKLFNRAAGK